MKLKFGKKVILIDFGEYHTLKKNPTPALNLYVQGLNSKKKIEKKNLLIYLHTFNLKTCDHKDKCRLRNG